MNKTDIENILISEIRVTNPRTRSKGRFLEIVASIAAVGLKRPITVSRRELEPDGTRFDLVCGQGRMEACRALGETTIPAVVTDAPPGHSWHEFGLAVDIGPEEITPGEPDWNETHPAWQRINAFAPTVGLFEGNHYPGKFKDAPHLQPQEIPLSPTDADRQDFLEAGMSAVWAEYFPT